MSAYVFQSESGLAAQFERKFGKPESQGFSTEKLDILRESLASKNIKALLIIKGDTIVCEWYAKGHGPMKKHYTASLAKALVGGMSLVTAINDGLITADEPACNYISQWKAHTVKSRIIIRHLATHSSGIEDAEQDDIPHMKLTGWKGGFWRQEPDPFTLSRDKAPIIFTPGSDTPTAIQVWRCSLTRLLPAFKAQNIQISGPFCGNVL